MKRKLEASLLLIAVGLLSLSRAEPPIKLGQGVCGKLGGVSYMSFGYDIRVFKFPAEAGNGKKEEIFDWTCKNKAIAIFNDTEKMYPDQLAIPTELNYQEFDAKVYFLDHFEAFTDHQKTGVEMANLEELFRKFGSGLGAAIDMVVPNATVSYENASASISRNAEQKMGTVGAAIGTFIGQIYTPPSTSTIEDYSEDLRNTEFRVAMNYNMRTSELSLKNPKHLILQQDFIDAINELPASFIKNPQPFLAFIARFGTHYMKHAIFGGRITYRKTYKSSEHTIKSREVILKEFTKFFKKHSSTSIHTSEEETRRFFLDVKKEIVGGNVGAMVVPYTKENIEKWEESVYRTSTPVQVTFVPITDLVANDSIRVELAKAIVYSVNEAHVEKYRNLMKIINPSKIDSKQIILKKAFERAFNNLTEELNILSSANDPMHYVDMITKTTQILRQVDILTALFDNIPAYAKVYAELEEALRKAELANGMIDRCTANYIKTRCQSYNNDPVQCLKHSAASGFRTMGFFKHYYNLAAFTMDALRNEHEHQKTLDELQGNANSLKEWDLAAQWVQAKDVDDDMCKPYLAVHPSKNKEITREYSDWFKKLNM